MQDRYNSTAEPQRGLHDDRELWFCPGALYGLVWRLSSLCFLDFPLIIALHIFYVGLFAGPVAVHFLQNNLKAICLLVQ